MDYKIKNRFKIIFLIFSIILIAFLAFLMIRCLSNAREIDTKDVKVNQSFREELISKTKQVDYSRLVLKIGDKLIKTEAVFSPQAKSRGLSNRETLEKGEGMLFLMPENGQPFFVMREMNFPLDLIFINKGVIVKVFHQAEPEGVTYRKSYNYGPADIVLEVPGGYFLENSLEEGMEISIVN